eukprot:jgi/Botrbrau1/19006/Bobra.0100s0040.2
MRDDGSLTDMQVLQHTIDEGNGYINSKGQELRADSPTRLQAQTRKQPAEVVAALARQRCQQHSLMNQMNQMERWVQNVEHKCVYLTRTNQLLRASLEKKEKEAAGLRVKAEKAAEMASVASAHQREAEEAKRQLEGRLTRSREGAGLMRRAHLQSKLDACRAALSETRTALLSQAEKGRRAEERAREAEEALRGQAARQGLPNQEPLLELARLQKRCLSLEDSSHELERQLKVAQQKVKLVEGVAHDSEALREEVALLTATNTALRGAAECAENDKSILLDHLQAVEEEHKQVVAQLQELLQEERKHLSAVKCDLVRFQAMEEGLLRAFAELATCQAELAGVRAERDEVRQLGAHTQQQLREALLQVETLRVTAADAETLQCSLQECERELTDVQSRCAATCNQLNGARQRETLLLRRVDETLGKLQKAEAETSAARAEIDRLALLLHSSQEDAHQYKDDARRVQTRLDEAASRAERAQVTFEEKTARGAAALKEAHSRVADLEKGVVKSSGAAQSAQVTLEEEKARGATVLSRAEARIAELEDELEDLSRAAESGQTASDGEKARGAAALAEARSRVLELETAFERLSCAAEDAQRALDGEKSRGAALLVEAQSRITELEHDLAESGRAAEGARTAVEKQKSRAATALAEERARSAEVQRELEEVREGMERAREALQEEKRRAATALAEERARSAELKCKLEEGCAGAEQAREALQEEKSRAATALSDERARNAELQCELEEACEGAERAQEALQEEMSQGAAALAEAQSRVAELEKALSEACRTAETSRDTVPLALAGAAPAPTRHAHAQTMRSKSGNAGSQTLRTATSTVQAQTLKVATARAAVQTLSEEAGSGTGSRAPRVGARQLPDVATQTGVPAVWHRSVQIAPPARLSSGVQTAAVSPLNAQGPPGLPADPLGRQGSPDHAPAYQGPPVVPSEEYRGDQDVGSCSQSERRGVAAGALGTIVPCSAGGDSPKPAAGTAPAGCTAGREGLGGSGAGQGLQGADDAGACGSHGMKIRADYAEACDSHGTETTYGQGPGGSSKAGGCARSPRGSIGAEAHGAHASQEGDSSELTAALAEVYRLGSLAQERHLELEATREELLAVQSSNKRLLEEVMQERTMRRQAGQEAAGGSHLHARHLEQLVSQLQGEVDELAARGKRMEQSTSMGRASAALHSPGRPESASHTPAAGPSPRGMRTAPNPGQSPRGGAGKLESPSPSPRGTRLGGGLLNYFSTWDQGGESPSPACMGPQSCKGSHCGAESRPELALRSPCTGPKGGGGAWPEQAIPRRTARQLLWSSSSSSSNYACNPPGALPDMAAHVTPCGRAMSETSSYARRSQPGRPSVSCSDSPIHVASPFDPSQSIPVISYNLEEYVISGRRDPGEPMWVQGDPGGRAVRDPMSHAPEGGNVGGSSAAGVSPRFQQGTLHSEVQGGTALTPQSPGTSPSTWGPRGPEKMDVSHSASPLVTDTQNSGILP